MGDKEKKKRSEQKLVEASGASSKAPAKKKKEKKKKKNESPKKIMDNGNDTFDHAGDPYSQRQKSKKKKKTNRQTALPEPSKEFDEDGDGEGKLMRQEERKRDKNKSRRSGARRSEEYNNDDFGEYDHDDDCMSDVGDVDPVDGYAPEYAMIEDDLNEEDEEEPRFKYSTVDLADSGCRNSRCCLIVAGFFFVLVAIGVSILMNNLINKNDQRLLHSGKSREQLRGTFRRKGTT